MAISSAGIGSGLDVNSIVEQLMAVESRPLATIAQKEASYQAKLTALGSVSSALSSFQSALSSLKTPSKFQAQSTSSSDSAVATATATTRAVAGSYAIDVTALAQAHTLAARGLADTTEAIGSGEPTTLTFQFGSITGADPENGLYPEGTSFTQDPDRGTKSITIDSSNNSLQGIRDAINKANLGVTATIVSDGGETPYRLVLTSSKTGQTSSMKITVNGDAALKDLLAYDPTDANGQKMTETARGQNTAMTINGIAITSPNRAITDAIQGVTLNVAKTGSTTLSVTRDTAAVTTAVNDFVKAYNALNKTITDLTAYNPTTRTAAALTGDSTVRFLQSELRGMLNTVVTDGDAAIRTLSDIGVSFQKDGTLAVDSNKLQKAINENFDGIAALFAAQGKSSDSLVSVNSFTSATQVGKYDVEIIQAAAQGKLTGSLDLRNGPITIASGTRIEVKIDDVTAQVSLAAGSYSADQLAALIQSSVNGTSRFSNGGVSLKATIDENGALLLTSGRYGSASKVSLSSVSGTGVEAFLGTDPTAATGLDVVGTIGGLPATGSGQRLTGAKGTAIEGLVLTITGSATGARGTIDFARGYADRLSNLVGGYLGDTGILAARTDGINSTIKRLEKDYDALTRRLEEKQRNYVAEFTALDTLLASMSQTSSYLSQQLANLPRIE